ncbi:glycosyltransferase family 39 protein [Kitasatospora sp. NPDC057198]|uniref:glycosyltransferase family 39 protein n=1 Tax=Kitasatospora sp. NPDC057198 TaxID=3346046 RepID=UPI003643F7EE
MTVSATSSASSGAAAGSRGPVQGFGRKALPVLRHLVWAGPAALTLALCLHKADGPLLWSDELATWNAVNRSPREILALLHHVDAVVGVYYLLLHYWTDLFGHSLAVLRMPSALAMTGATALVVLTGRKVFNTTTGVVAGLLFALTPSVSRYGQEARGYAFVVLFAAAATLLLLRALERPSALRWLLYGADLVVVGTFHVIALVFLVPHAAVAAWRWWNSRARGVLIGFPAAAAGAVLILSPLVMLGRRQVGRQLSWLHTPTFKDVVEVFWRGLYASTWISLVVLALAVLPLAWPRNRRPALELGMIAVVPIPLLWLASQGHTSYFIDRYLLFTLPAWIIVAAAGLTALRPRALTAVGLIAFLLLGVQDQQNVRDRYARTTWDGAAAAEIIARGYQPGDAVAPLRFGNGIFYGVSAALDFYLPQDDKLKDVFVKKTAIARGDLYPTLCPDPAACLGDTKRIWVVTIGWQDPFADFDPEQARVLKEAFPKTTVTRGPNIVVTLMER